MAAAVAREDFASAAELRDALREAMDGDPRFVARRALRAAVADERYEDAARLRDELSALEPPPPSLPPSPTSSPTAFGFASSPRTSPRDRTQTRVLFSSLTPSA